MSDPSEWLGLWACDRLRQGWGIEGCSSILWTRTNRISTSGPIGLVYQQLHEEFHSAHLLAASCWLHQRWRMCVSWGFGQRKCGTARWSGMQAHVLEWSPRQRCRMGPLQAFEGLAEQNTLFYHYRYERIRWRCVRSNLVWVCRVRSV